METDPWLQSFGTARLSVRVFGRLEVIRDGVDVPLPASRKVRALLAYLALAPRPVARSQLCELLWEIPNDPRGELRWSLSKLRSIVDVPDRRRVDARQDAIRLDLSDSWVDAIEVIRAEAEGIGQLAIERCRALCGLIVGEFLDGLEIDRSPSFAAWLNAQRRHFRATHAALLARIVSSVPDEEAFAYLEHWVRLAPFDHRVHQNLMAALVRRGGLADAEQHLAATVRLFETEGLDTAPLREAWRFARTQQAKASDVPNILAASLDSAGTGRVEEVALGPARRASIAIMPFVEQDATEGGRGTIAAALVYDVIARLAKLRCLFVIAQGTVFALHERQIGPEEAGQMLKVDYVVGGAVRCRGDRLTVNVELTETQTARIVWTEVFNQQLDDAFVVLDEIGNQIVASVASEIETIERNRAILKAPASLDAWEAHHRGLWHMYRFSRDDNVQARRFFETAVRLDPTFARAYAGLSFTHFQDAFQGWTDRAPAVERAYAAASQSLLADDRDPAAHWAMGRALWLRGTHDQSVLELEQAVDLSPNFALGHYTLAFVQSQAGDPGAAIAASDYSRRLSPFDPLLFGMLGARAMALVRQERFAEASEWAVKAAARPNAHTHILGIAALSLALAGSLEAARVHAAAIEKTHPGYGIDDFLAAFQFDEQGAALFRDGARLLGMR